MTCINKGGDGSSGGCGKMWVDVSYLWDDVDCPECLKLRPTQRAADVCHDSPSKTHSWYGSSQGYVCEHCGTRR